MTLSGALPYGVVFGAAALACLVAAVRARTVDDPELRAGLLGLLLTSAAWAATHVGVFVLPQTLAEASYLLGLLVGFATVWAWLYFCSAYTGRTYHRQPAFRWLAVGLYLAVAAVKLTNPWHGLYFETAYATTPFPHLTVEQGVFHWAVTGFSYALAVAGIFTLLDLYAQSDYDTRPLVALAALTGLPVALDIVGYATPLLVDIIYAPLGVGAFAIGVLFLFEDRFLAVRASGTVSDPLVFLDQDGRVRDFNEPAADCFPGLTAGRPLDEVVPGATEAAERGELLEVTVDGRRRYFVVSDSVFGIGETSVGRVVVLADVTDSETRRRELARHNRQLEDFAGAMTHELRNSLQVVDWNVRAAAEAAEVDGGTPPRDPLDAAADTTGRMSDLVDDFTTLARHGQTVDELGRVDLRTAAEEAHERADADVTLTVAGDATVEAGPRRLRALLVAAIEFADRNGARAVTVEPTADGFALADDGDPPMDPVVKYFEYDEAVPSAAAGMKLPTVRSLARVHGWETAVDAGYRDGVRVVVSGVRVRE